MFRPYRRLIYLSLLPVASALLDAILETVCLGRGNFLYYLTGIPLLIDLLSYHNLANLAGYTSGDYATPVPLLCEVFFASHDSAGVEMATMVGKLDLGIADRGNSLGYLRLSDRPFTCRDDPTLYEDGYCGIGIGMPNAQHSRIRPFLDEMLGTGEAVMPWGDSGNFWNLASLKESARDFIAGRTTMVIGVDPGNFYLIEIHRRMLGIVLTEEEAGVLQEFMVDFLFNAVFLQLPIVTDSDGLRAQREGYINMYVTAIESRVDSGFITTLNKADSLLAANGLLDAFIFAAIPSLTGMSSAIMGVYLHNLGDVNNQIDWNIDSDLGAAIMECVRVYPPVLGIPYIEGNTRFESLVGYSGYDFGVFGADSHDFRVRMNVEQYRAILINWADKAIPVPGKPETSRVCPARSLSFNLLLAFLSELDITSWMEGEGGLPTVQPSGSGPTFWGTVTNPDFNIQKI